MNPEVKKIWVDALRSDEYKQAKGALKTSDGYCCLGVLCDLYIQHHPELGASWKSDNYAFQPSNWNVSFPLEYETLPDEVQRWAELESHNPVLPKTGISLAELNDDEGYTFNQIANVIEEEL